MTISRFVWDRRIGYGIRAVAYILTLIFLLVYRANGQLILAVTALNVLAVLFYELWDYGRRRGFYQRMMTSVDELDQKYLLPELLSKPEFYEGELICDALRSCDRSMAERVREYQAQAADFREYIELWVHEAKLPVASLRLINHNAPGQESGRINVQLKRLDDCIDNVLYYARSENAEKDHIIKEVSLKSVFSKAAIRNREALQLIGGSLLAEELDVSVVTDGKWLEFILGQLMANSIKYASPKRPLEIRVSAEEQDKGTVLRFWDNGIGIRNADLPYIFEKSFTGQNGRRGSASTGMGLYIVKTLCERLGHAIRAGSEEDRYTEICIAFGRNDLYRV